MPVAPVIDLVSQEDQHSPIKSSASELSLTLGKDGLNGIEGALRVQEPKLLDSRGSFPDDGGDNSGPLFPGEDALFSLFLRSRSPSFSGFEDVNDNSESDHARCWSLKSDVTNPQSNGSFAEKGSDVLDTIESGTIESEAFPVTTTKPRITLKETASPPKVLLRLTQPRMNKIRYSKRVSRKRRQET